MTNNNIAAKSAAAKSAASAAVAVAMALGIVPADARAYDEICVRLSGAAYAAKFEFQGLRRGTYAGHDTRVIDHSAESGKFADGNTRCVNAPDGMEPGDPFRVLLKIVAGTSHFCQDVHVWPDDNNGTLTFRAWGGSQHPGCATESGVRIWSGCHDYAGGGMSWRGCHRHLPETSPSSAYEMTANGEPAAVVAAAVAAGNADPDWRGPDGMTALHKAAELDLHEHIRALADGDMNRRDRLGRTPLFIAASGDAGFETVRDLLVHGANPNIRARNGETPLYWAAKRGEAEMIEWLLRHRARVNVRHPETRHTPLDAAALAGHDEAARVLKRAGGRRVTTDAPSGNPFPLHAAASDNRVDEVRQLLANGGNPNQRDRSGATPLLSALLNGHGEAAMILLEAGSDPGQPDRRGRFPILQAAHFNLPEVVRALLDAGAYRHATDPDGRSALWIARDRGHREVEAVLLSR